MYFGIKNATIRIALDDQVPGLRAWHFIFISNEVEYCVSVHLLLKFVGILINLMKYCSLKFIGAVRREDVIRTAQNTNDIVLCRL